MVALRRDTQRKGPAAQLTIASLETKPRTPEGTTLITRPCPISQRHSKAMHHRRVTRQRSSHDRASSAGTRPQRMFEKNLREVHMKMETTRRTKNHTDELQPANYIVGNTMLRLRLAAPRKAKRERLPNRGHPRTEISEVRNPDLHNRSPSRTLWLRQRCGHCPRCPGDTPKSEPVSESEGVSHMAAPPLIPIKQQSQDR